MSLSADGRYLLTGGDETVRLWELDGGRCIRTFDGADDVEAVLLDPVAGTGFSVSADDVIRYWPMTDDDVPASGTSRPSAAWNRGWPRASSPVWTIETACADSAGLSPDGRTLVTGEFRGMIRMWDTATGTCPGRIPRRRR